MSLLWKYLLNNNDAVAVTTIKPEHGVRFYCRNISNFNVILYDTHCHIRPYLHSSVVKQIVIAIDVYA